MTRTAPAALILALLLPACGPEDSNTAPVLSQLNYAPATLTAGQVARVSGTFDFEDPDGDIEEFWVGATTPAGIGAMLGPQEAVGASGETSGQMGFQIDLDARLPGTYVIEVWVVDAGGNESNRLQATLPAQ